MAWYGIIAFGALGVGFYIFTPPSVLESIRGKRPVFVLYATAAFAFHKGAAQLRLEGNGPIKICMKASMTRNSSSNNRSWATQPHNAGSHHHILRLFSCLCFFITFCPTRMLLRATGKLHQRERLGLVLNTFYPLLCLLPAHDCENLTNPARR